MTSQSVWSRMTPEEQAEITDELNKILLEEINKEVVAEIQRATAKDKLGNKLK